MDSYACAISEPVTSVGNAPVCLIEENPYRLVSLWDMLRAHAEKFTAATHYISTIEWHAINSPIVEGIENPLEREARLGRLKGIVKDLGDECARLGIRSTKRHIDRFLFHQELSAEIVANFMQEIFQRFQDDLRDQIFVQIPQTHASLYENPLDGWEPVIERIDCKVDISEAGLCLALERSSASVFHIIGVLQACLNVLAKSLRVKVDLETSTWNKIINHMETGVNQKQLIGSKSKWKKELEPFYSEVLFDLKAIKNAWRNPTMHFWKGATEAEARKIYDRTKDFALLICRGPVKFKSVK